MQSERFNILDILNPTELFYKISNKAKDSSNTDSSKKLLGHAIFGAGTI